MIRVAIDGRLLIGERRGIGKGTLQLVRSMIALRPPLHFEILLQSEPPADLIAPASNWSWTVLRPSAYPLWEQLSLPWHIRRERPAILHCPSNTGPVVRPAQPETRFVLTVHDFIFEQRTRLRSRRQRLGRRYRRWALPRAIEHADWLICVSEATRGELLERYPQKAARVSVIPTPVAENLFATVPDRVASNEPDVPAGPYFLAFGGIEPRKNVPRIRAAFSRVRAAHPDTSLVLVGAQGSLPSGGDAGVLALRYVSEPLLARLYRSSLGLVYPSLSEGFGVPIIEALALRVSVITSDRDPMRQLAAGAAILVDPENVESIAEAMTRLLRDPVGTRQLAGQGRRWAENFRADRVAQQMVELYLRLVRT